MYYSSNITCTSRMQGVKHSLKARKTVSKELLMPFLMVELKPKTVFFENRQNFLHPLCQVMLMMMMMTREIGICVLGPFNDCRAH